MAYKKGKRKRANRQETPVPNLPRPLAIKDFSAAAFADDEPGAQGDRVGWFPFRSASPLGRYVKFTGHGGACFESYPVL